MFVLSKMYIVFLSDRKAIHFFNHKKNICFKKRDLTNEADTSSIYFIQITLLKVYLDCSPNKLLHQKDRSVNYETSFEGFIFRRLLWYFLAVV